MACQRLALIFPPAMHPTSPPLGLACLQAYLRKQALDWQVRVFDLNLAYYRQGLAWMQQDRLRLSLKGWDHRATCREVTRSVELFQGRQGLEPFLDLEQYERRARVYRRFENVFNGLFEDFARRLAAGLEVPALAQRFFAELMEPVRRFRPQLAGLSLLFSQQLYFALALARELKRQDSKVLLGGATLSVMPQPTRLLAGPIPTRIGRDSHPCPAGDLLDYLVAGEGETALAALLRHYPSGLEQVPGLIYPTTRGLQENPPLMVDDLGSLPCPDFRDLDPSRYHSPRPVLPLLTSRGCYWARCAFCTHNQTYLAYRQAPIPQVVEHLAELQRLHRVRHFALVDEMIHPRRFQALSRALARRGLDIRYSAYAKPVAGFTPELLDLMYRQGSRLILWGVESGSQRVLDLMDKGVRREDMERVLRRAHRAGIWNLVFLLFGFPTETGKEWDQTLEMVRRLGPAVDAVSKSRFLLMAGSPIQRRARDFAITGIKTPPEQDPVSVALDYQVSTGLTPEQVRRRYRRYLPKLESLGRSPWLALFRDHMLIAAAGSRVPAA